MGCLTLPIRLFGLLTLVLLLLAGWLYRDRLLEWGRGAAGARHATVTVGLPTPAGLSRARTALARLGRGADSVVLGADETASLLRDALGAGIADQMDSLRIQLGDGRVGFRASLRTARLPRELLGPLAVAVRGHEPVSGAGAVRMVQPGEAEWAVDRLTIRDFPLPSEAVPRAISRAFGDTARRTLRLALPRTVRGLRVRSDGVTLFAQESR